MAPDPCVPMGSSRYWPRLPWPLWVWRRAGTWWQSRASSVLCCLPASLWETRWWPTTRVNSAVVWHMVSFTLAFGVGSLAGGTMGYVADWGGLNAAYLALGVVGIPGVVAAVALVIPRLLSRDE